MTENLTPNRSLNPQPSPAQLLAGTPAFVAVSAGTLARIAEQLTPRTLNPGEVLATEGDPGHELFLVVSGKLRLTRRPSTLIASAGSPADPEEPADPVGQADEQSTKIDLGSANPGDLVGELSLLTGQTHIATLQAEETTTLLILSSTSFDQLCEQFPEEMTGALNWLASRLDAYQIAAAIAESPLFRQLSPAARRDLAEGLKRTDLAAGEILFREDQPGDALYLVLSGRMRIVAGLHAKPGSSEPRLIAEFGKGDVLGELALLTGDTRSASAVAVRDSHLARLDKAAFDRLVAAYPVESLGLFSRQLASRLRERNLSPGLSSSTPRLAEGRVPVAIAVLPLNATEQSGGGRDFAGELVRQLSAFGPTLHLNQEIIRRIWPDSSANQDRAFSRNTQIKSVADRRLAAWLDDMEMLYRHVVYEADYQTGIAESSWTARCLRQADVLLMVAGGPADPKESEKTMVRLSSKALPSVKTTLVLIHAGGPEAVAHTRIWKSSLGIHAHEHVRRTGPIVDSGDVGRIARKLNRQSVGLVLGGGFALGLAHIGVVDAMRELNIPIDFVGGTSMGAIIAAAAALEFTHDQMLEVMDKGCAQALKGDYTLPMVSLLTGRKVALALGKYLEHRDIEDLWLPYFAISASLVKAKMIVHREGSALRSVLASCRAPGMFPPLGWQGDVLVDGGLVNNIPADVMRDLMRETISGESAGATAGGTVFAVDVSPESEFLSGHSDQQFGMDLSGWKVARRNANPLRRFKRSPAPKHATIADILMRLIRMGGVAHNQQIRASADLYLSIPLEDFSVKDFHRGEEMSQVGYHSAIQQLTTWIAQHGRPWLGIAAGQNAVDAQANVNAGFGAAAEAGAKAQSPNHPPA